MRFGANRLTGMDACEETSKQFARKRFPLKVTVQNLMPRDVVFPEIEGLFLRHVSNAKESVKTVEIRDLDQLMRLVSGVQQIADLNNVKFAMDITAIDGRTAAAATEKEKPAATAKRK